MQTRNVTSTIENKWKITELNLTVSVEFFSHGIFWYSQLALVSLWNLPVHLFYYLDREWNHYFHHMGRAHSADSHAFFHQQFLVPRNLLCVNHSAWNAYGSVYSETKHFYLCLCCTNVLLPYFRDHRVLPPGSDGLWSIFDHMQPSVLSCSHEPKDVLNSSSLAPGSLQFPFQ